MKIEKYYTEIAEVTEFAEKRAAEERSLGCATQRTRLRREGKNRAAPPRDDGILERAGSLRIVRLGDDV